VTETPPGGGPTVLRMILARQLQELREKAGMSYEQAAGAIYSTPWTIRRMERAEGGLKPLTVKSVLLAYGVTDVREIDAWHAALYGMFNVFRQFPARELPDVVYGESLTGAYYLNKPEEAARYIEALDQMCAQAASPAQTVTILRDLMKET